jgi:hypothetical protein
MSTRTRYYDDIMTKDFEDSPNDPFQSGTVRNRQKSPTLAPEHIPNLSSFDKSVTAMNSKFVNKYRYKQTNSKILPYILMLRKKQVVVLQFWVMNTGYDGFQREPGDAFFGKPQERGL